MSKSIANEVKLQSLKLYRHILKLHQTKLTEDMRVFGDYFVKNEFTQGYHMSDENQLRLFNTQWETYLLSMKGLKDVNKIEPIGEKTLKGKMDLDQMKSLNEIKQVIKQKN
jgi:hypothetical protein